MMGEDCSMKNAYKNSAGKLDRMRAGGVDGRIVLAWILTEYCVKDASDWKYMIHYCRVLAKATM
jgi:hypothetical protein